MPAHRAYGAQQMSGIVTVRRTFDELTKEELYRLLRQRVEVFVVEQNCPYMELDDLDQKAVHVWLEEDGRMLAYLRVMDRGAEGPDVSIGRVLSVKRGQGYGSLVLEEGIRAAKEVFGAERIYLEAQVTAVRLYERQGFRQISGPFSLDGIPHVGMILDC